jgi:hypothetical protein
MGFSGACGETGTQLRTVTARECADGSCNDVPMQESRSCMRDTDDDACGATTTTDWSACGGFDDSCDQTGTQTRMVTTRTCASGSCDEQTTTEMRTCNRSTEDDLCDAADPCSGLCKSGACDIAATENRDCDETEPCAGKCDATGNCVESLSNGESCDDGLGCTDSDSCTDGVCAGSDSCGGGDCTGCGGAACACVDVGASGMCMCT